jgi:hypothetical protein
LASATSANAFSLDNLGGFAQFVGANSPAAGIIAASRPSTPSSTDNSDVIALPELDPELVVIFKKISKRDSVTKVKALEELEAYLQANKNFIGLILNTWVKQILREKIYRVDCATFRSELMESLFWK